MDKVAELIKALSDENADIRKHSAEELGEFKDTRAVEPLLKALYDDLVIVRRSAVEALSKIGDARAVDDMASTYLGADRDKLNDPIVRFIDTRKNSEKDKHFVADAILRMGPPSIDELIYIINNKGGLEFYDSAYDNIRWEVALLALWKMQDERSTEPINRLLRHNDNWVRRCFADFLGEREEHRATDLLIKLLEDDFEEVRNATAIALSYKRDINV